MNPLPQTAAQDTGWLEQALCGLDYAYVWTTEAHRGLARHMCEGHCPVINQCRARYLTPDHNWAGCVVAGIAFRTADPAPMRTQPERSAAGCWKCPTRMPLPPARRKAGAVR